MRRIDGTSYSGFAFSHAVLTGALYKDSLIPPRRCLATDCSVAAEDMYYKTGEANRKVTDAIIQLRYRLMTRWMLRTTSFASGNGLT